MRLRNPTLTAVSTIRRTLAKTGEDESASGRRRSVVLVALDPGAAHSRMYLTMTSHLSIGRELSPEDDIRPRSVRYKPCRRKYTVA